MSTSTTTTTSTTPEQDDRSPLVLSVVKAFNLLETVAATSGGLTLGELSKKNDLHPSTTHRLLHTLIEIGYIRQEARTRRYHLGSKSLNLVSPARQRIDVADLAADFLRELAEQVEETANLYIRDGDEVVHVSQSEAPKAMRIFTTVGTRLPIYCTASGKALLANLPAGELDFVLERLNLERHAPNTITQLDDLRVELSRIRRRGYAVDDEEQEIGVRGVGAVIRDHTAQPLAAISVSGPSGRISVHRLAELAQSVQVAAARISHELGYAHAAPATSS